MQHGQVLLLAGGLGGVYGMRVGQRQVLQGVGRRGVLLLNQVGHGARGQSECCVCVCAWAPARSILLLQRQHTGLLLLVLLWAVVNVMLCCLEPRTQVVARSGLEGFKGAWLGIHNTVRLPLLPSIVLVRVLVLMVLMLVLSQHCFQGFDDGLAAPVVFGDPGRQCSERHTRVSVQGLAVYAIHNWCSGRAWVVPGRAVTGSVEVTRARVRCMHACALAVRYARNTLDDDKPPGQDEYGCI